MYGNERVDTLHILLAAAEVSPRELHGQEQLTPSCISAALAELGVGNSLVRMPEHLPRSLTPATERLLTKVMSFAAKTERKPSLRDVWVALCQERGLVCQLFEQLNVDQEQLCQYVSGA